MGNLFILYDLENIVSFAVFYLNKRCEIINDVIAEKSMKTDGNKITIVKSRYSY